MRLRIALSCVAWLSVAGPVSAKAGVGAYDQCVSYPQASGFNWSPAIIAAFCADWHVLPIEYAEIQALLDNGQGRQLDTRFEQVIAGYFAGTVAEGSARQAFMANFDYGGQETATVIERWLQQSPGSAYALAARGIHHVRRASEARGPKAFDQIPREDVARMEREVELAEKDLTKALLANSRLLAAYEALLHGARINSEQALGETALKGALQADPKNYYVRAEYMHWLQPRWGGSLEAMSRFAKEAERHLRKNPRLASLNTQALAERAWFTRGNDSHQDLPLYENALLAAPFMPALTSAAYDAGKLGKHQRSVELYSQVLRFWPNSVYELTQRGSAYADLGNHDLARADLERALKRSPDDASALREYAHLHQTLNDNDKAIEILLRARKADADDTWTLQRLAWLYVYKKRDPKQAEPLVNELIKREPRSGAAWLLRADVIQNLKLSGLRQAAENFVRYADTTDEEQRRALPKVKAWLAKHPDG
jgi:tetratricopeptide (TPR) repeat protein